MNDGHYHGDILFGIQTEQGVKFMGLTAEVEDAFNKEWCMNMAEEERRAGDPEIGAGRLARDPSFNDSDISEMMNAEEKRDHEARLKELDMSSPNMLVTDPSFNEEWAEYMRDYEEANNEESKLDRYNDPLWHPNRDREQE